MVEQAVILAGGLGTRLGELTKSTPKPLLSVNGKPFLTYLIWNLQRRGFRDIVLSVGYRAELIQETLKDGSDLGVRIRYSIEDSPLGTGGGVRCGLKFLESQFLVLNGDSLFDVNYRSLWNVFNGSNARADGLVALRKVEDVSRYGSVTVEGSRIVQFNEKGPSGAGLINGGIYVLKRSVIEEIPAETKVSLETEVFPRLTDQGKLDGMEFEGYFLDIGLPETFAQAQVELPAWQQKSAAEVEN